MKKFKGFSAFGVIIGILAAALVVVAIVLVANRGGEYDGYDWYAVIDGDSKNGEISDHIKGPVDAPVKIVEFADFQCPGCASLYPYVEKAIEEMDGKLAIIYRNYLLSYHQNATAAASAAEAAGLQGYWQEFGDLLFDHQADWEYASASERTELFNKYFVEASGGKGDLEKFNSDLASAAVSKKLSFDQGLGKAMGVSGTPAFFVDGQFIDWSNKNGGQITVNNKTFSWDSKLTLDGFVTLLKDIAHAKLDEPTSMD